MRHIEDWREEDSGRGREREREMFVSYVGKYMMMLNWKHVLKGERERERERERE